MNCRLCLNNECEQIEKMFYCCKNCELIFKDPGFFVSLDEEKARYENHINGIEDQGYVNFLNRAIDPALEYLNSEMVGLDLGSGPGPTLDKLLDRQGIKCEIYDPFFAENNFESAPYDFIFSTETFEHFHDPRSEVLKVDSLLANGGYLIVMTDFHSGIDEFKNWYYKNDETHVCFYCEKTFDFICDEWGYKKIYCDTNRVIILQKVN